MYNILVDGKVVATNVSKSDLREKVEQVRSYCNLFPENRFSRVTSEPINNPETIA